MSAEDPPKRRKRRKRKASKPSPAPPPGRVSVADEARADMINYLAAVLGKSTRQVIEEATDAGLYLLSGTLSGTGYLIVHPAHRGQA